MCILLISTFCFLSPPVLLPNCNYRCSVAVVSNSLWPHGLQHARLPCPSPSPGVCSNSSPLNRWCHPTISSSVTAFFSRLQSFPTSGSFPMSWLLASGDQSIRVSALASVLAVNIQGWFSLEWTGWISLQSNGLSRVFSSTTILSLIYGPTLTSAHNCNCSFI